MRAGAFCLSSRILRFRATNVVKRCQHNTQSNVESIEEYKEVKYPEIKGKYPPGNWSEDFPISYAWHLYGQGQNLLEVNDVRERLETISGDKNIHMFQVGPWDASPKTLAYKQFITRTHIVKGLPDIYNSVSVDSEYESLRPLLISAILQEHEYQNQIKAGLRRFDLSSHHSNKLLGSLLNAIFASCGHRNDHLLRAQIDQEVRLETFWKVTGYRDIQIAKKLHGRTWMQYKGKVAQQIRTELPLPEFLPLDNKLCVEGQYPETTYHPRVYGQQSIIERPITMAGHWVGDPCEFIHLAFQLVDWKYFRLMQSFADKPQLINDAWMQTGLISSFASCVAQAHNQGFNVYLDVTYPFTSQTIVMDGTYFQPFAYQLNTFHIWQTKEANPLNNIVWVGDRVKLYETIENGEVKGLNDEALVQLLKCVLLKSADRGCDLRPYLSKDGTPVNRKVYINHKGDPPLEHKKIERFQYPRNAVYF